MLKTNKLEEQIYTIKYEKGISDVSHIELLWENKQIIRLQENIFNKVSWLLKKWKIISLYNIYDSLNINLIKNYKEAKKQNNSAVIAKIIWSQNNKPILEWNSLHKVTVIKMDNVLFEDITDKDLCKSLVTWNKITVEKLLEWLSKEFYKWNYNIDQIIEFKKLFFRQIKL